jgi:hypothetical protein
MKSFLKISCLLLFSVLPVFADISIQDTTGPNEYYFSSGVYYVDANATNASVEVDFIPGNRSWIGSVAYQTTNDTAVAGQDYTAVSGTLSWSGPALRSISVPLHPSACPTNKAIHLSLIKTESNSIVSRSDATLIILAPPPTLSIGAGPNGTIRLSWPAAYTNYSVETITGSEMNSGQWTPASGAASFAGGQLVMDYAVDGPSRFFRLRKQ